MSGLRIAAPDLSGQLEDDANPVYDEGRESDSQVGFGWQGGWVNALLETQAGGQSLGERTKLIWDSARNPHWAVEVRLEVYGHSELVSEYKK
jgi:hypothetical protein